MSGGVGCYARNDVVYCLGADIDVACSAQDSQSDIPEDCDWQSFGSGRCVFDWKWNGELGRKFQL